MRHWFAVIGGLGCWLLLGATGLAILRWWPAYAIAEPTKAYTFGMLLSRLTIALMASAVAGAVAAKVAGGNRPAWWVGGILLAGSAPIHLAIVWADYPVWYHLAYLLPLIPVNGLSGTWFSAARSRRALQ